MKLERVEFHRTAIGILADPGDRQPGTAIRIGSTPNHLDPVRRCTCLGWKSRSCSHLRELEKTADALEDEAAWEIRFGASLWFRLAEVLCAGDAAPCANVRTAENGSPPVLVVVSERRFVAPISMLLRRSQVPAFLAEHREALGARSLSRTPRGGCASSATATASRKLL